MRSSPAKGSESWVPMEATWTMGDTTSPVKKM